ncbi:MAG TPA: aminoglycoside phosphotransferase family protein [Thermoplasmata archaeon]
MTREFAEDILGPLVLGRHGSVGDVAIAVIHRAREGRVTVRYSFDSDHVVYGKLYTRGSGSHACGILRELWGDGFGEESSYRVPEPIAYLPHPEFLLTKAVPGTPLVERIDNNDVDGLTRGSREAARWLVRLHRHPIRVGKREPLWESARMTGILKRLTRSATAAPDAKEPLWRLVESLLEEAKTGLREREPVQIHARFHPEHAFNAGSVTSLIDFDESVPSDPARDLAEFLTMMRMRKFRNAGSVSSLDAPTRAFLDEYLSLLPQNGANLRIHWGGRLLVSVLHLVSECKDDPEALARAIEFGSEELDRVMSGEFLPGGYDPV